MTKPRQVFQHPDITPFPTLLKMDAQRRKPAVRESSFEPKRNPNYMKESPLQTCPVPKRTETSKPLPKPPEEDEVVPVPKPSRDIVYRPQSPSTKLHFEWVSDLIYWRYPLRSFIALVVALAAAIGIGSPPPQYTLLQLCLRTLTYFTGLALFIVQTCRILGDTPLRNPSQPPCHPFRGIMHSFSNWSIKQSDWWWVDELTTRMVSIVVAQDISNSLQWWFGCAIVWILSCWLSTTATLLLVILGAFTIPIAIQQQRLANTA